MTRPKNHPEPCLKSTVFGPVLPLSRLHISAVEPPDSDHRGGNSP